MSQCQKNVVRFLLIVAGLNIVFLFFRPDGFATQSRKVATWRR